MHKWNLELNGSAKARDVASSSPVRGEKTQGLGPPLVAPVASARQAFHPGVGHSPHLNCNQIRQSMAVFFAQPLLPCDVVG